MASSATPRSSSWVRRWSGLSRVRAPPAGCAGRHPHHLIDDCSITPIRSGGMNHDETPTPVDHLVIGAGFAGLVRGDQAGRGRRARLPRRRAGLRRRRHLARQHLPRRRLRRPEPALLVLVRAATPTGRARSRRSPRSRPTCSASPASPACSTGSCSTPTSRTPGGTTTPSAGSPRPAPARYVSRTLISGAGALVEPRLPDIDGIDSFQGEVFHSARWDHDVDLAGKRVAVIGTGASAIQIVPEIAQVAGHLDVYQRTAPWVLPRNDRPYTAARAARCSSRLPAAAEALPRRRSTGVVRPTSPASPSSRGSRAGRAAGAGATSPASISDPALRERLTPDFRIGLQADPDLQHLLPRRSTATTSTS